MFYEQRATDLTANAPIFPTSFNKKIMDSSLIFLKPASQARCRIIFYPYAGGSPTAFHAFSRNLPSFIEACAIRYPVTTPRVLGSATRTAQSIAAQISSDIARYADLPLIFFGYSMGATVAFETCIRLLGEGFRVPSELVVAASKAPHLPRNREPISSLPDEEFTEELRKFGGTPDSVLRDRDMMNHYLPFLRADFATAENYKYKASERLTCPITAIGGKSDRWVSQDAMAAWKLHTSNSFKLHDIEGGHFFIHEQPGAVMSLLLECIDRQPHA